MKRRGQRIGKWAFDLFVYLWAALTIPALQAPLTANTPSAPSAAQHQAGIAAAAPNISK